MSPCSPAPLGGPPPLKYHQRCVRPCPASKKFYDDRNVISWGWTDGSAVKRALATLLEDLDSIPSIHTAAIIICAFSPGGANTPSRLCIRHHMIQTNTYIREIKTKNKKQQQPFPRTKDVLQGSPSLPHTPQTKVMCQPRLHSITTICYRVLKM